VTGAYSRRNHVVRSLEFTPTTVQETRRARADLAVAALHRQMDLIGQMRADLRAAEKYLAELKVTANALCEDALRHAYPGDAR
jgi:hypothetical protein